jgi:hypothetical protein
MSYRHFFLLRNVQYGICTHIQYTYLYNNCTSTVLYPNTYRQGLQPKRRFYYKLVVKNRILS